MKLYLVFILLPLLLACENKEAEKIKRPRDTWAFRSVLDRKPRMLTLALDSACYAAYDLANCHLYKVWKGGVILQGAAFTDKKNIQPVSWGASYSDSLPAKWQVEMNGKKDSFQMMNKGYRFENNQVYLKYVLILSSGDTVKIEERPEYIQDKQGRPGLERMFSVSRIPAGTSISLVSPSNIFALKPTGTTTLIAWFQKLPQQFPPAPQNEYDHRGRYWMEKSDCFTCHELDKKTVGPSFIDIAGKYQYEESPESRLIQKVKQGGAGAWGTSVMNAHPDLTEYEIRVMLEYILSLKPKYNKKQETAEENKKNNLPANARPGFGLPLEDVHPSYDLQTIHKTGFKPKVGGLAFMPDGRLLVSTWDSAGAVFLLDGVESGDSSAITVKRIASGLAEPLGIEVVDGEIFVLQKQELTKLTDTDGDEIIDEYEAVCNSWGATADFHEFSFGLVYKDGYFYATLSMAMRLMSHEKQLEDRGRTIKINREGNYEWINYGLRTPNGIGIGVDNEIFVSDNQGEWVPANKLIHVKKGEYHGMRWGHLDTVKGPPPIAMPAIWLPEDEIGNSPSEPILVHDGPYKGQMLHGDVTYGGIQRDFLEKINDDYQGAVFRFTQGLEAGVNRIRAGPDSALYIGGVGMVGGWSWKEKQYGLQRMKYNGRPCFDLLAVRAKPDGFEIEFTQAVDQDFEKKITGCRIEQWNYLPTADYGGPKRDLQKMTITGITVSSDRKRVYLVIPGLKKEHVVYFRLPEDIKNAGGQRLWSSETWYTLNNIPG